MIATQIAPLSRWSTLGASIGVTWKGRQYTEANPVVSTWVEAAYSQDPNASLEDLLANSLRLQRGQKLAQERDRYYRRLPRRGEYWRPHAHSPEELVVWTVRRSRGCHHAYIKDLTATVMVRSDRCVIPAIRDGLGNSLAEMIVASPSGTPPAVAVRQLIAAERTLRQALVALTETIRS